MFIVNEGGERGNFAPGFLAMELEKFPRCQIACTSTPSLELSNTGLCLTNSNNIDPGSVPIE